MKSEAVNLSLNAMETTITLLQQLHQRLDEQNSKSNEQLDIINQLLQSQLESIVDQIDQLDTGVNQVLLNKIQNLDNKNLNWRKHSKISS